MIRITLTAFLALTACAAAVDRPTEVREQARIDRALAGLMPGAPQRCLRRDEVNQIQTFKDTILYVQGRGRIYRNNVSGGCAGLRYGDIVISRSYGGSDYCAGDIIQTRPAMGPISGSCTLGEFIPYRR